MRSRSQTPWSEVYEEGKPAYTGRWKKKIWKGLEQWEERLEVMVLRGGYCWRDEKHP